MLQMVILVYASRRILRTLDAVSEPVDPTCSIVAGESAANDMGRCIIYGVLHTVAHRIPRSFPRAWVDDVSFRMEGRKADILLMLPKAAQLLASGLRAKGFGVSPKSVVFASDPQLAAGLHGKMVPSGSRSSWWPRAGIWAWTVLGAGRPCAGPTPSGSRLP